MNTETKTGPEQKPDFEKALQELEDLVARLESGDLSLDDSLKHFKRGVELTRMCQSILDDAQQTVDMLDQEGDLTPPEAIDDDD